MNWALLPLRRYVDFSGRSRRKEFWCFALFEVILYFIVAKVENTLGLGTSVNSVSDVGISYYYYGGPLVFLLWLILLVPNIAVGARRLHDQNRTGWLLLLWLVPLVGLFALIVLWCLEGTRGPNDYGPDPKQMGENAGDIFA